MLYSLLQRSQNSKSDNIVSIFIESKRYYKINCGPVASKQTECQFLRTFFNNYAFTFIININGDGYNRDIKEILAFVKKIDKQNKAKYSQYFFTVSAPQTSNVLNRDGKIEISLIKENFGYIIGYSNIYQCSFYGNYPYNQKVFCENLYNLPSVFRKFIEENQDKPEKLLEFFRNNTEF